MTNKVVKIGGGDFTDSDYHKAVSDGYQLPENTMMYSVPCTGDVDPKGVLHNAVEDDPQGVAVVSIDAKGEVSVASGYLAATNCLVLLKRGVEILEGILNERVEDNAKTGEWYDAKPDLEQYFGYTDAEDEESQEEE